jgi:hypothetical protein
VADATASGGNDWIGRLELATEAAEEIGRLTARVIGDVNADIIAMIEAERPARCCGSTPRLAR